MDSLYVQFSTITYQQVVFLVELMIPIDDLYLEGSVLIKDTIVTQLCLTFTLTVHWQAHLKGATTDQIGVL